MGYRPAISGHAIVPSYSPGLPLLMAIAERAAGACGPYYVVPVMGGLCVLVLLPPRPPCRHASGRRLCRDSAGVQPAVSLSSGRADERRAGGGVVDRRGLGGARRRRGRGAHPGRTLHRAGDPGPPQPRPAGAGRRRVYRHRRRQRERTRGACGNEPDGLPRRSFRPVAAIALVNWRLYGSPLRSGYDGLGQRLRPCEHRRERAPLCGLADADALAPHRPGGGWTGGTVGLADGPA